VHQPQEALKTARLLAKHQGFSKAAGQGLLRALAFESLASARDADQLQRIWAALEPADRADPLVAAHAAQALATQGEHVQARLYLWPFWIKMASTSIDERAALAQALMAAVTGLGPEWLGPTEVAINSYPREAIIAFVGGCALAERQLWGKSRLLLEPAAQDTRLTSSHRRHAWRLLAQIAQEQNDSAHAALCYEAAARLPG
jgi:HemY protein